MNSNLQASKSFRLLLALGLALGLVFANNPLQGVAQGGGGGVVSPLPGKPVAQSTTTAPSSGTIKGPGFPGSGLDPAAAWLLSQQQPAGCFGWTPGDSTCTSNTQGTTARGLLQASLRLGKQAYLDGAIATGNYLISAYPRTWTNGDPRFATYDPIFLEELSTATGDSAYANFVQTWFWDKLSAGTYGDSNLNATQFGSSIVTTRANQGIVELSPWDIAAVAIAANLAGETASRDALMTQVQAGLEATTASNNSYDVIGLAGAVWASAVTGVDLTPSAGVYAGLNTAGLAAKLAEYQRMDSSWPSGTYALASPTYDPTDSSTQTTAFAILALGTEDPAGYADAIAHGAAFIRSLQDTTGQFLNYPGAASSDTGGIEGHAEALYALATLAPSVVYVNGNWIGQTPGSDPDGSGPATAYGYDAFATVHEGVDAVAPGGTVNVEAGTYVEQLTVNKPLTLQGADQNTTIIQSPDTLSACFSTKKPVVCVNGADATITNLTVDGAGKGNSNYQFVGIAFYNAGGTVDQVKITGIRETPLSGSQHGVALYALNNDNAARTLTVSNNTISDYQKNGMALSGNNLTVSVTNNTVSGSGPLSNQAQNGIQVSYGAGGTVTGNTVSDNFWTGTYGGTNDPASDTNADGASGILLYEPGSSVEVANNTLTGNQFGVWSVAAPSLNIHNNSFTGIAHTGSGYPTGVAIWDSDQWSSSQVSTNATINNNSFATDDYGILVRDYTAGGAVPVVTAHLNTFAGSAIFAAWSDVSTDAAKNWWNDLTGPSGSGTGSGEPVSTNVGFTPWCGDSACTVFYPPFPTTLTVSTASGPFGGTADLSATLTSNGSPISGKTVDFTLNGVAAGSGTTDTSGVAKVTAASLAGISAGVYPTGVGASFAGDSSYSAGNGSASLTVNSVFGQVFDDVPTNYWAVHYIMAVYYAGITSGCSVTPLDYCPTAPVTRAQMAVFLLRGIHGSTYIPPAVGASTGFDDVPITSPYAPWIKELALEGITSGCGNGNYCPDASVTREEMAVFLLRAEHTSSYTPPAVGSTTGFNDVPTTSPYAPWIKQLVLEGITSGCGNGNYCPSASVTRDQMAVFLTKTFNLPVP